MSISPGAQIEIMNEVARAPSVHNIQPARWRFTDDRVTLYRALDRTLPVADPTGRDLNASLGASFEGMAIALSSRGLRLGAPESPTDGAPAGHEAIASATVVGGLDRPDPLAPMVQSRLSFRGRFEAASREDVAALAGAIRASDVILAHGDAALQVIAPLHDAATWFFESNPAYHAELWSWLRLSPRDPRYSRDGLNGACLDLSAPEAWIAQRLLAPKMFARLKSLGVARHLVSERAQVKSATVTLLLVPETTMSSFNVGRRMYRLWLEVTRAGFYLAPMSASADHEPTREALTRQFRVPAERRIANVFRVGMKAAADVARSPRLPVEELLV